MKVELVTSLKRQATKTLTDLASAVHRTWDPLYVSG
ncbi:hypothetical protein EDB37_1010115 [Vibrio crassostreae]|nr:hypothetical protein EDB37_1010115 [Vibrio crassostreae]